VPPTAFFPGLVNLTPTLLDETVGGQNPSGLCNLTPTLIDKTVGKNLHSRSALAPIEKAAAVLAPEFSWRLLENGQDKQ
jgi:hypothetical protein